MPSRGAATSREGVELKEMSPLRGSFLLNSQPKADALGYVDSAAPRRAPDRDYICTLSLNPGEVFVT